MKTYLKSAVFLLTGVLAVSCGSKPAATEPVEEAPVQDEKTITLSDGTTTLTWVKDNQGERLMNRELFSDAPDSLIEQLGVQEGLPSSVSTFVMHADGEWILFDAGLGPKAGGQLLAGLEEMGLTPDSISYLYITHYHGDHIGGMLDAEGKPVFSKSKVYAGAVEHKAWMEMPEDKNEQQRATMEAYKDQLTFFEFGDTLPHGVVAMEAVGHTPGHAVFQKENLLVIGDLMHGAALQYEHPEYSVNFDMDKAQAAVSRQKILKYAQDNKLVMAGMHLPEPAFINPE